MEQQEVNCRFWQVTFHAHKIPFDLRGKIEDVQEQIVTLFNFLSTLLMYLDFRGIFRGKSTWVSEIECKHSHHILSV